MAITQNQKVKSYYFTQTVHFEVRMNEMLVRLNDLMCELLRDPYLHETPRFSSEFNAGLAQMKAIWQKVFSHNNLRRTFEHNEILFRAFWSLTTDKSVANLFQGLLNVLSAYTQEVNVANVAPEDLQTVYENASITEVDYKHLVVVLSTFFRSEPEAIKITTRRINAVASAFLRAQRKDRVAEKRQAAIDALADAGFTAHFDGAKLVLSSSPRLEVK